MRTHKKIDQFYLHKCAVFNTVFTWPQCTPSRRPSDDLLAPSRFTPRGDPRYGDARSVRRNCKIDVRCTIQNAINLPFELPVSSAHYAEPVPYQLVRPYRWLHHRGGAVAPKNGVRKCVVLMERLWRAEPKKFKMAKLREHFETII